MRFVRDVCILELWVCPYATLFVTRPTRTMKRLTGPLAIFLTLPFLLGSHAPADVFSESGNPAGEGYCPSVTVQISISSGYIVQVQRSGVVGTCRRWQVLYNAHSSGEVPVYFHVYEVRSNGAWKLLSSAVCGPSQGICRRHWGSVASSSEIVVIGTRPSGGIAGAVAELDTLTW